MKRGFARRPLARLPLLIMFMLFQTLHAQGSFNSPPGQSALAEAFVNEIPGGNVKFFVDAEGKAVLPILTLRQILGSIVKREILDTLAKSKQYARAEELEPLGIALVFDSAALTLRFTVATQAMEPRDIGASTLVKRPSGGEQFAPEAFSAMLGASATLNPSYAFGSANGASVAARLGLDPSLRLYGIVAQAGVDMDYPVTPLISLRKAFLSYDLRELGARAVLGTIDPRTVSFQVPTALWGIGFSSETSLPGGKKRYPPIIDDVRLERPADLTIEINGTVVRKIHLLPGSYRLSDLPFDTGRNSVTLRIAEEGSAVKVVELGLPFDGAILPKGQMEYAVNMGFDRETLSHPLGFAEFSIGTTPYLELGLDASASLDAILGGPSLLWASPVGSIAASGALASAFTGQTSSAAGLAARLEWRLALPGYRYLPRLGAGLEYRSKTFAAAENETEGFLLSAQLSQLLPFRLGSLGAFGNALFSGGTLTGLSTSAGIFISLGKYASISASGGADWDIDRGLSPRASVSLSVATKGRQSYQVREDLIDWGDSFGIALLLDEKNQYSLAASGQGLITARDGVRAANLAALYSGDAVDLSASGSFATVSSVGESQVALALTATSTLAYAGGYFGLSPKLGDAFLFLVPDPSLGKDSVELLPEGGRSYTSTGGQPVLVPSLVPYVDVFAAVQMPGSAPDRRPLPENVSVAPTYRSGTIVRIKAAPDLAARGRLVDAKGALVPNLSGKLFLASAPELSIGATFSDEKGIFECYGLAAGDYLVQWADSGKSRFAVAVAGAGAGAGAGKAMIELGDVKAIPPDAGVNK